MTLELYLNFDEKKNQEDPWRLNALAEAVAVGFVWTPWHHHHHHHHHHAGEGMRGRKYFEIFLPSM